LKTAITILGCYQAVVSFHHTCLNVLNEPYICGVHMHNSILYGIGCDVSKSPICSVHMQITILYLTRCGMSISLKCSVHIANIYPLCHWV
jgi:hypothetical protein